MSRFLHFIEHQLYSILYWTGVGLGIGWAIFLGYTLFKYLDRNYGM